MKNTTLQKLNKSNIKKWGACLLLLNLTCINSTGQFEQNIKYGRGVIIESSISGNGHGIIYNTLYFLNKERVTFGFGPSIHKKTIEIAGGKVYLSYKLTDDYGGNTPFNELDRGCLQMGLFSHFMYINNMPLSKATLYVEKAYSTENTRNWNNLRLSTFEGVIGMEVSMKIAKRLLWKNYIGFGAYYHTKYEKGLQKERVCGILSLGTGINIFN